MCICENLKMSAKDLLEDVEMKVESCFDFDNFVEACKYLKEIGDMYCSKSKFILVHAYANHLLKKFEIDNYSLDDLGL